MDHYNERIKDFVRFSLANHLEVKSEEVLEKKGSSIMNYSLKISCLKLRDRPYNNFFELLKEDIEKLLNNENIEKEEE